MHHKDASKKRKGSRDFGSGKENMKPEKYKSFDELPLMLSVPELASVLVCMLNTLQSQSVLPYNLLLPDHCT